MEFLTLDKKGLALAVILGVALLTLGQAMGPFFVLTMLLFLVLSAIVTSAGRKYKGRLLGDGHRGVRNVLANGLPPLIMALVFFVSAANGAERAAALAVVGFVASVAAITADKFESEIGVFAGKPRLIFGFRRVRKGTSGALTVQGLAAGVLGAMLIAPVLVLEAPALQQAFPGAGMIAQAAVLSAVLGGFLGSIVDSMFGYYEERKVGNKFTTNFACGVCGGAAGMLIFLLVA